MVPGGEFRGLRCPVSMTFVLPEFDSKIHLSVLGGLGF